MSLELQDNDKTYKDDGWVIVNYDIKIYKITDTENKNNKKNNKKNEKEICNKLDNVHEIIKECLSFIDK